LATIRRRRRALNDLASIYRYLTREASAEVARRYLERFEDKLGVLAANPGIGTRRIPGHPDVRLFPVERHLVFYRPLPKGDGIEVIRILHGARNWQAHFGDED